MDSVRVIAPAKINIGLSVLSRRADGYHDIATLFACVSLCDELEIEKADGFSFSCDWPDLPTGEDNLVVAAFRECQRRFYPGGAKIRLKKKIPAGAGLAGGSSDAAATIIGLMALSGHSRARQASEEIADIALCLGSDVPFLLEGGVALGRGRGELLEPQVIDLSPYRVLLAVPKLSVSTGQAYSALDGPGQAARIPCDFEGIVACLKSGGKPAGSLSELAHNDFEEYAFGLHPQLAAIKKSLLGAGALFASLSGTGSTVYGIFDAKDLENAGIPELDGCGEPQSFLCDFAGYGAKVLADGKDC